MKALKIVSLVLLATIMAGCSTDTGDDEEPKTLLCNISGVWVEYAYLSDGVFIDVSDAAGMVHYEFAIPDNFTQYIIATMTIKGRTPQSNIIIKAKRMQQ